MTSTNVSLSSIASVFNGKTPSKSEAREEGFPVLKIKDVDEHGKFRGIFSGAVESSLAEKHSRRFIKHGDILLLNAAHNASHVASKLYRAEPKVVGALPTGEWMVIRPDERQVDQGFLAHWATLPDTRASFRENVKGIHLYPKDVERLGLRLPPLSEQRRIAAILDQADALRGKRRAALTQLDEMAGAIFGEMFGNPRTNPKRWPVSQLSDLVKSGERINYGVIQPGDDVEGGVPLVRVSDLRNGRVNRVKIKSIAPNVEKAYARSRLHGDEILISCVGSIGLIALTSPEERGFNIARAVCRVRPNNEVKREFLAEYLRSEPIQDYFESELRTSSQPTLNIKQIAETSIQVPPLSLQQQFVERLEIERTLRTKMFASEQCLLDLFTSLQHRAFAGEL